MIISRTPFRLSLFGGGSDYPQYYLDNNGAVLSTTINRYCQLSVRYLPPFFEHKHRIVWSQIENVQTVDQIQHPIVRESLKYLDINDGMAIHHDGDLPARSGMGASSAFSVGLLNALYTLKGENKSKMDLALEAIHVERDLTKANCGSQDQVACSIGGLNLIKFSKDIPQVLNIPLEDSRVMELQECLMLVFTGFQHDTSQVVNTYNFNKKTELKAIHQMALHAYDILEYGCIVDFGKLLNEAWQRKKTLSNKISTPYIDYTYDKAIKAGALGGKLLGSGGGGFLLLFVEPEKQAKVKKTLEGMLFVPIHFEDKGTTIILRNGI